MYICIISLILACVNGFLKINLLKCVSFCLNICYNLFEVSHMDIGERIREMRKDKKMTQRELAALTGVAENTIRQYELHLRKPKVEQLKSIARVFDCSLDYLTGADDEPETAANHLERVFAELGYTIVHDGGNIVLSNNGREIPLSEADYKEMQNKVLSFIRFTLADKMDMKG